VKKAARLTRQQVRREIDRLTDQVGREVVQTPGVDTIYVSLETHPAESFVITLYARTVGAQQALERQLAYLDTRNLKTELLALGVRTRVDVRLSASKTPKTSPARSVREQRMHFRP
jgi:hypothetical protein